MTPRERFALIAGNGQFPLLVLREASRLEVPMVVIGIREETRPEIEQLGAVVHWVSLGELERALGILRREAVEKVVLAGQVKHSQIYSRIAPDGMLQQLLASLPAKNTDALIGAVARQLQRLGFEVVDSTQFLRQLLAPAGQLSERSPDSEESADIAYGRHLARELARLDLGQTVVVSQRACVAIEAMEGTDAAIKRAGEIAHGRRLVVVKVSKPGQDMRFDVPVVGIETLETMQGAGATALALDAGRTLIFDREEFVARANQYRMAVVADLPEQS